MVTIKRLVDEGLENLERGANQQVKATIKAAGQQLGVVGSQQQANQDSGTNASVYGSDQQAAEATREVVKSYYAPSDPTQSHGLSQAGGKKQSEFYEKQLKQGKTPEEAAKIEALRQKLHKEYFESLTRRPTCEEKQQEEEKKEEEEKKMKQLELEEKKKRDDDDIALRQAQQKVEKFPGISG